MNDMTEAQHLDAPPLALAQALRIDEIHPSPTNPRKTFPEDAHAEMVKTVLRHGVMSPILVRPWPDKYTVEGLQPKYELIAGERRYRAAKEAGLEYIPGTVRDLDDHETIELQIIENLHRKDLNELEEAEGYEVAMKKFGYTAEQLADKIKVSKAYIYARLKLTALCEKAREAFRNGLLDASRALLIARIPIATLQIRATKEITESYGGVWSYRQSAEWIQRNYMLKLTEAPFPRADETLVAGAGKCHPCPKRTGSSPELYPDVKSADICTDPECFAAKKAAWMDRQKSEAEATGKTVLLGDDARKIMPYGAGCEMQHYVVLDRQNDDAPKVDGEKPTYRTMLADAKVETMMVEDTRTGKLVEVAKRSEVKKAMVAAGITPPATSSDREREAEAKVREENEFRRRLHRQVRTAFFDDVTERGAEFNEDELRLVTRQFWSCTWHENQKKLSAIWVESEEKIEEHERNRTLFERIGTMTPAELCLLLIDLSLIGQTQLNTYSRDSHPTHLLDMAKRLNVSPDTIRREMQVEKEEKAAKKKGKAAKAVAPVIETEPTAEPKQTETATPSIEYKVGERVSYGDMAMDDTETYATIQSIAENGNIELLTHTGKHMVVARWAAEKWMKPAPLEAHKEEAKTEETPAVVRTKRTTTTGKIEALYTHPENADLAWTGRGRKPKWVEAWLDNGGTLEQLLAKKRPAHKPKGGKSTLATSANDEIVIPRCDKTLELQGLDVAQTTHHAAA
ncbi:MAG TPA: ParB/RepB/Spo0J family partition protein [Azonexus sp.]|nr:ParB/RepB/Spo0J family partition protein [Azonexus sp.]